ncbi:MAG: PEP-CTERM sorting domain-containing protein [Akkermansiaceae bacterium]|nr:PEP-CTERM sorting domain-containing protein [Akkermansiaceae bacterium]
MKTHLVTISSVAAIIACSPVQAALVDFTAGGTSNTLLSWRRTNTNGGTPTIVVGSTSLLERTNVALGNNVTANISVTTGNSNAYVTSGNAGLGLGTSLPTTAQQLGENQLLIFTFSNVQLNGGALPGGVTVNFDLNHLLWTDATGRGFVFDGSNNRPSFAGIGVNGAADSTTDGFLDDSSTNATLGSVSSHDLAFSTSETADTYELAPSQTYNFTTEFQLRNRIHPTITPIDGSDTYYVQGFDITANVVPEPTSTALLGLGSVFLMLRRRK